VLTILIDAFVALARYVCAICRRTQNPTKEVASRDPLLRKFWNPSMDNIPDVRDGLTRLERTILYVLYELRKEVGDRHVSTFLVWGRVVEYLDVSKEEFTAALQTAQEKAQKMGERGGSSPATLFDNEEDFT
jgi:hypothetical protein